MKRLIFIGGPMGVGKTTVCRAMQRQLPDCVFLDGDWCWDARPFRVTEETKEMVMDNIAHVLNNFLGCSAYENVLFCWVMQEPDIQRALLSRLDLTECRVEAFSLVCSAEALTVRLQKDVDAMLREPSVIGRGLAYLPLFEGMERERIDTTGMTACQAAQAVLARLHHKTD